ncbi:transporter substrate-binding domain-containing protein [bacterium]|nr:transporter substrate-binding domain-containing protein [bacterium]
MKSVLLTIMLLLSLDIFSNSILTKEEIEYIKNKKEIFVTGQTHYPPFEFLNEKNEYTGISVELINWIAKEFDFKVNFYPTSFNKAQERVLNGDSDMLIDFFYSEKRAEKFDFLPIIFNVPTHIFTLADRTNIKSIEDLKNLKIASQKGDYSFEYIKKNNIIVKELIETENFSDATELLLNKQVDAIIGDEQIILYFLFKSEKADLVKRIGKPLYEGKDTFAVKKGNSTLYSILNKGLKLAKDKGVIEDIYSKWLGIKYKTEVNTLYLYKYQIAFIGLILALIASFLFFRMVRLKKEVDIHTVTIQKTNWELLEKIREEKSILHSLEESNERYRVLVELSTDAIFLGNEYGEILDCNDSATKIFGYTKDEFKKMFLKDLLFNKEEDIFPDFITEDVVTGDIPVEKINRRKNGLVFYSEMNTKFFRVQNKTWVIAYIRDITRRKITEKELEKEILEKQRIEAELFRAQKLDSLGVLAGGIAHDFNNILTAILGNISYLKTGLSKDNELINTVDDIEKAGIRAKNLANQLLTFAKGGEPQKELTDVRKIIKDSAEFILTGSKTKCIYKFANNLPNLYIDRGQISQVIQNIVLNAAQAMNLKGTITITVQNLAQNILLMIEDSGTGISEENLKNIFDPYFTTKKNGHGLGLAISYSIIKKHNGILSVQSKIGKGTIFSIELPATNEQIVITREDELPIENREFSILFMDDEEIILKLVERITKKLGHQLITANCGEELIDIYKNSLEMGKSFDVIIMDLTVPGKMGGEEAVRVLRKINPNIKAIVTSGYSNHPILSDYKNYGFDGVITKPFMIQEFIDTLSRVIIG